MMNIDIKSLEKEMEIRDEDNELLILYRGSNISSDITGMINRSQLTSKIVNREVILDTVGKYNLIYTVHTDIETICDLLTRECMGYSIKELTDTQKTEHLSDDSKTQTSFV